MCQLPHTICANLWNAINVTVVQVAMQVHGVLHGLHCNQYCFSTGCMFLVQL